MGSPVVTITPDAAPAASAPVTITPDPPPGFLGKANEYASKALAGAGLPTSLSNVPDWFRHLTGTHPDSEPFWAPIREAIKNPTQENLVNAVPFIGPSAVAMSKDVQAGNYGGAAATLAGTLGAGVLPAKSGEIASGLSKTGEAIANAPGAIKEVAENLRTEGGALRPTVKVGARAAGVGAGGLLGGGWGAMVGEHLGERLADVLIPKGGPPIRTSPFEGMTSSASPIGNAELPQVSAGPQPPALQGGPASFMPKPTKMTLSEPPTSTQARPTGGVTPEEQFQQSFGPEYEHVRSQAEWETGKPEGNLPQPPALPGGPASFTPKPTVQGVVNEAMGVKPLEPKTPLREQPGAAVSTKGTTVPTLGTGKEIDLDAKIPTDVMAVFNQRFYQLTGQQIPEQAWNKMTTRDVLNGFGKLGVDDEIVGQSNASLYKSGYRKLGDYHFTSEGVSNKPQMELDVTPTKGQLPPAEADPIKAKYPDPAVRQMVRANGERMVQAVGNDPDTMKAVHDLTRVDLRQAAINHGIDMGQTTVSNSKFAGEGSITRENMFNMLLDKNLTPKDIIRLAKQVPQ